MIEEQNDKIEDGGTLEGKQEYKVGRNKPPLNTRFGQKDAPKKYNKEKGTVNRSTVARQVLGMMAEPPEKILESLKAMYPKFFEKKSQKWQTEFIITTRLAQKAMEQGDVQAYNALMDSAYGRENSEGKPTIVINLGITKEKYKS